MRRFRSLLLTLFLALSAAWALPGPVAVATPAARPLGATLLVVAPPWASARSMVERAGGRLVGGHGLGRVAFGRDPDFADRLWHGGAWLVMQVAPDAD
jgi:hypothetical protein